MFGEPEWVAFTAKDGNKVTVLLGKTCQNGTALHEKFDEFVRVVFAGKEGIMVVSKRKLKPPVASLMS